MTLVLLCDGCGETIKRFTLADRKADRIAPQSYLKFEGAEYALDVHDHGCLGLWLHEEFNSAVKTGTRVPEAPAEHNDGGEA